MRCYFTTPARRVDDLRQQFHDHLRRGVAAVETAVCLPFLILMVFSGVEFSNAVFLKQSVNLAAFEAAKVVVQPGQHSDRAVNRIEDILTSRGVAGAVYSISPPVDHQTARGVPITVTVQAPANSLSMGPISFMNGRIMSSTVTMARM